jgi:hypothetical protein
MAYRDGTRGVYHRDWATRYEVTAPVASRPRNAPGASGEKQRGYKSAGARAQQEGGSPGGCVFPLV